MITLQISAQQIQSANLSWDAFINQSAAALQDPQAFWAKQAERLDWFKPWDQVCEADFTEPHISWFSGGQLNVSYNCLDRHINNGLGAKTAIIWEGDQPGENKNFTFSETLQQVNKFAAALRHLNVTKGDRVLLYMPMIPELAFACLACTRIGAIHSVVFAGFSADSLERRIADCEPKIIITSDGGLRHGKQIPIKAVVDAALAKNTHSVATVIVVNRLNKLIDAHWQNIDVRWEDLQAEVAGQEIAPEICDAEQPLFILYTSGSTGKPKGVLHTTAGYLLGAALSHAMVFDIKPEDIYWCTADIGWITGHSYLLYGPLANGTTTLMFEGTPMYPDAGRFWAIIEKYKVTKFYTAPTAIRMLQRQGDEFVKAHDLSSLQLIGTVGEPINPEAWRWYAATIGQNRCPVVDTWWQTETGSILITPLPCEQEYKPGCANHAFFGVDAVIMDENGQELTGACEGLLCIKHAWPSMLRGIYKNPGRFKEGYFARFPGLYLTGDRAQRDAEGSIWILGRSDDVMNVAGHRIGSAEIENALVEHEAVNEAAVIGVEDEIRGQAIYAFVTLHKQFQASEQLANSIAAKVGEIYSKTGKPKYIQWTQELPKTRSGKIMRRILRKIAEQQTQDLGDTSTLADPTVVEALIRDREKVVELK